MRCQICCTTLQLTVNYLISAGSSTWLASSVQVLYHHNMDKGITVLYKKSYKKQNKDTLKKKLQNIIYKTKKL